MKKYTSYWWIDDNEAGIGVCLTSEFSPTRDYHPETGHMARPSQKIAEFNTLEDLADILIDLEPEYYYGPMRPMAYVDASNLMSSI